MQRHGHNSNRLRPKQGRQRSRMNPITVEDARPRSEATEQLVVLATALIQFSDPPHAMNQVEKLLTVRRSRLTVNLRVTQSPELPPNSARIQDRGAGHRISAVTNASLQLMPGADGAQVGHVVRLLHRRAEARRGRCCPTGTRTRRGLSRARRCSPEEHDVDALDAWASQVAEHLKAERERVLQ
jgi:hypothetical protein